MNQPAVIIQILLIFLLNPAALLGNTPEIITNEAVMNFPESLVFNLEIESEVVIDKVILVYSSDGRSCQSGKARKEMDFDPAKQLELDWEWDFARSGTIPPGVRVEWQWEISDHLGTVTITEPKSLLIEDQRQDWQLVSAENITVQWFVGGDSFGQEMHQIALDGRERVSAMLGIEFEEHIWITVYPSPDELRDALKFSTEWVGGIAFTDHNAMMIVGAPGQDDWLNRVIPHESAHMMLAAYTFNCKGNWMPNWFREGLAEYAESGLDEYELDLIEAAFQAGDLPKLRSLVSTFSHDSEESHLQYKVSHAVIDYLIEEYGSGKMAELLDQLASGKMIDPALEQVYGMDTDGVDAAWRGSYGLDAGDEISVEETAPAAKTPIPTLALYPAVVQPTATATVAPPESPEPAEMAQIAATSTAKPEVLLVESPVPTRDHLKTNYAWIIPGFVLIVGFTAAGFIYIRRRV